ncbi:MAG: hypothetical protein U0572_07290 [Phycisphaerales bacterium]
MRRFAAFVLVVESFAILAFWVAMFAKPEWRRAFIALDAPHSTLLAFLLADATFTALGIVIAYGLATQRRWAWPLLCVHAGMALYASLYALFLPVVGRGGSIGALVMLPVALASPIFAWALRPRAQQA